MSHKFETTKRNGRMYSTMKFKGSKCAKELENLFKNELLDLTISAKQAYELSDVFKAELPFDKFSTHYYNWRRKRASDEEQKRTFGCDPPDGKLFSSDYWISIVSSITLRCACAQFCSCKGQPICHHDGR